KLVAGDEFGKFVVEALLDRVGGDREEDLLLQIFVTERPLAGEGHTLLHTGVLVEVLSLGGLGKQANVDDDVDEGALLAIGRELVDLIANFLRRNNQIFLGYRRAVYGRNHRGGRSSGGILRQRSGRRRVE